MNIDDAFEGYMAAAYNPPIERDSAQWRESRRVFMAGVHLTACMVRRSPDPRLKAVQIAAATMAFAKSLLNPS